MVLGFIAMCRGDSGREKRMSDPLFIIEGMNEWSDLPGAGSDADIAVLAEIVSARVRVHEMALRSIAAELGGVLRVTDRTVQARIDEARDLVENYPATLVAWEAGRITRGHVRVIQDAGCPVPAERRAEYEALAVARCEGDTPNRVRAGIEILAERLTERSFTERHRDAATGRRVRV
ncbi:MAG: hypothetical protein DI566_12485, partial [Microbacterium sp.]